MMITTLAELLILTSLINAPTGSIRSFNGDNKLTTKECTTSYTYSNKTYKTTYKFIINIKNNKEVDELLNTNGTRLIKNSLCYFASRDNMEDSYSYKTVILKTK